MALTQKTMNNLEFYTNTELIEELLSRTTFAGIILKPQQSVEEAAKEPYIQFDMMWTPTLTDNAVENLLEVALSKLKER